jgi:polar amino acid transport system substrate-binding protein
MAAPPDSPAVRAALAPAGTLRVAVWRLDYFATEAAGRLTGIIPDLGDELARRLGVPAALIAFATPADIVAAFRARAVDVTFLGITADRAAAMRFGPPVIGLQSSFLVANGSPITAIADVAQPGLRIAVPAHSAQEAHLRATHPDATLVAIPPTAPGQAIALLRSGAAEAFCHVVPMLAAAQPQLPGARILPGSTFTVPVAIACAKDATAEAGSYCDAFVQEMLASGFVAATIARAGVQGLAPGGA